MAEGGEGGVVRRALAVTKARDELCALAAATPAIRSKQTEQTSLQTNGRVCARVYVCVCVRVSWVPLSHDGTVVCVCVCVT